MQYRPALRHLRARALITGLLFVAFGAAAYAGDSYDPSTHLLSIPSVLIGSATYSNMVVTPDSILCLQGGTPNGSEDTYYPNDSQLFIPSVAVGPSPYANVLITVGSLVSVGSVAGADSYNGQELTISSVQVLGGSLFSDVIITIGRIVSAGGGMPANVVDVYDPASKQLTIAGVQVGTKVYTNAIVTVGKIVSVGASRPAKSLARSASSSGACTNTPLNIVTSALPGGPNGGLIVPVGGMGNIAAFAVNQGGQELTSINVTASTGAASLPLTITMCQTTVAAQGCSELPTSTLTIPSIAALPSDENTPSIALQVAASAAIASDAANQILITFRTLSGTVVGSASVPVSASVLPIGVFAVTASGNGVVTVPVGGQEAFTVAANNQSVTSQASINVSSSTNLPVTVTLCQTNPNTGQCLGPPAESVTLTSLAASATVTFSVFVSAPTALPDDPAANLIFVNFETSDGTVVGSTSVGVTTN
jgi:hypothetical protein